MSSDFDQVLMGVWLGELPRRSVCRVEPSTPLGEVYRRLAEEQSVAVLVCAGPKLLGIFTEQGALVLLVGCWSASRSSRSFCGGPLTSHVMLLYIINYRNE